MAMVLMVKRVDSWGEYHPATTRIETSEAEESAGLTVVRVHAGHRQARGLDERNDHLAL
jgi:hypothetical protein